MTAAAIVARGVRLVAPGAALRLGASRIGGKAYSLARLTAAGERVPEWAVLPADALEMHLLAAGAMESVRHELETFASTAEDAAGLARTARRLEAIVDALLLDLGLLDALDEIATTLGGGPFAVRSSAIGEDGDRFSFAGQFETVLNVGGRADELADAVRRCWRSAFSARVLDYRRRGGSLSDASRLAVIVQRMVPGDASGVLFTIDPVTGDADRMRVSACAGLGEALVSGAVDADEYVIRRDGAAVEISLANANAAETPLGADALAGLAALGRRIEERDGGPRDIEWTIREGELWVLQARPVTSAPPSRTRPVEHRIIWDNSNIQESYCGVTTPLTFSFARVAYASVYEQTMRTVGVSEATIAAHRPMLRNLLGLLHGRVYYNLNHWYRGLLLLPAFGRNKADMERMMGVEEPVDFVVDEVPGARERLRRLPRLARTFIGLLRAFATLDRDTTVFLEAFDARIGAVNRASLGQRSLGELMEILDGLRRDCIDRWVTPIVNDFRVMMATGRLRRIVEHALPDEAERVIQTLLGGADVAASAGPAMLMLRLADIARANPGVMRALRDLPAGPGLAAAGQASGEFAATLKQLLGEYGDRCMGELKLESRSLHDDPGFVVRMLRNYIDGRAIDPHQLADSARQMRLAAEQAVESRLGSFMARYRFRRALLAARRGIRTRESMRLARTRLFGAHRDVYRAIGAKLHELGRLERADDVLYLTTQEIDEFWSGTAVSANLAGLVRERRAEFAAYEQASPPNRIVTTGIPHPLSESRLGRGAGDDSDRSSASASHRAAPVVPVASRDDGPMVAAARVLRGLGCSAGVAEGVVRIVRSASDDLALDGHILVAPRTDPGWAPLFPCARGIIVERGSLLSHSAVLARELGIPAVVGIPGIVGLLRDGERVRVDGTAGTIERLDVP
jgi:pyruvate,water dikinase